MIASVLFKMSLLVMKSSSVKLYELMYQLCVGEAEIIIIVKYNTEVLGIKTCTVIKKGNFMQIC